MRLDELAAAIGVTLEGDGSAQVTGVGTLEDAKPGEVSFLANAKYADKLAGTKASAVVVAPGVEVGQKNALRSEHPYLAFCQAVVKLVGYRQHGFSGVHPLAFVDDTATVGEGTIIYPFCHVGANAVIGRDCVLHPNVTVYDGCKLGDRVTLHAGCVIGQDGFGYATDHGVHHKIPMAGNTVIEDDVEMGAGCCVDRATLGSTVIGKGSKFSNLVTIGHGSKVGPGALFVAQVGIAGSVTVGHHVSLGGQVGVAGHLKIGDNVMAAAQSGISADVPDQGMVIGSPAIPLAKGRRVEVLKTQLPDLLQRIRKLEQQIEELQATEA
jgi:UDP-3-O-[3-hydroxymyristoyl] glucosamine N-acyltransferase